MLMKLLYPEIDPFNTFFLQTGSKHSVYVEQCGNPQGLPVVFLHGGPCSGCKPDHRRFFNPDKYHIILFDQRGCGRSTPYGELDDNTTRDLIDDMERIREALGIGRWLLFGGSWGGALALLYAQQHNDRVAGLVVRGIFLARQKDLDWFVKDGAGRIYPEQWRRLISALPQGGREDPVAAMWRILNGDDELAAMRIAKQWSAWGSQVSLGSVYQYNTQEEHANLQRLQQVRMEIHYARSRYFIAENQILQHCGRLRDIPTIIIHGRNDMVCPAESAFALYRALPHAEYVILSDAGHLAQGEQMIDALVTATDKMVDQIDVG